MPFYTRAVPVVTSMSKVTSDYSMGHYHVYMYLYSYVIQEIAMYISDFDLCVTDI